MALGNFLPEEQDLLIGIFYRVGYWISHIDDTDLTDESEHKEQKQMEISLKKVAASKAATDLVQEIASEALRRSGDQARWLRNADRLLEDVTKSVKLVHSNGTDEDMKSFRKSIMYVATSVARAYREEPEEVAEESAFARLVGKAGALLTAVKDNETYQDQNISPAEDTALHELAAALRG